MTKEELLHELTHHMYIALQPSPLHGIGVFAVAAIPKGCKTLFAKDTGNWVTLSFEEAAKLPVHSREFVETYYLYDEEKYFIPDHGCKIMDMASYLNHSSTPNIISVNEGEYFETVRDIQVGEELLIDYGEIVTGVDEYK